MILTEDHAPVFPEMLTGWKQAKNPNLEYIQWKSKIVTRNGEHYVKTRLGESYRVYGPCQSFAEGDYICRDPEDHTNVFVVRQKKFWMYD